MESLADSFYKIGGGSGGASSIPYAETEVEFGDTITLPTEGTAGYELAISHLINHVFLNGIKLRLGATNDYTVDINTNSVVFSNGWTLYNQDIILITT